MSTEQRENLEAILRQSAFPAGSDVSEQRRLLRELISAQPLPADVTVTAAALGGVPTAEITVDGIEPRHVVLYFHGGVYVLGDAFQAAGLASQVGRRTRAKVISVDYRLAPEHPYPAAVDDALAAYEALLRQRHSPVGHRLRGRVRRRRARRRHPGQRPRSRAAPARRGLRHVTVCRPHPGRDDHGNQARGRPADEPGKPPIPGHRLHGGTRRRSRPHQPHIRRPVRPAAPDHPGRNPRGSPRRRRPPRAAGRHRRRRGHPRHHPRGAARLPGLSTRSSTKRPRRWTEPDSSCRRISPAQNASPHSERQKRHGELEPRPVRPGCCCSAGDPATCWGAAGSSSPACWSSRGRRWPRSASPARTCPAQTRRRPPAERAQRAGSNGRVLTA